MKLIPGQDRNKKEVAGGEEEETGGQLAGWRMPTYTREVDPLKQTNKKSMKQNINKQTNSLLIGGCLLTPERSTPSFSLSIILLMVRSGVVLTTWPLANHF